METPDFYASEAKANLTMAAEEALKGQTATSRYHLDRAQVFATLSVAAAEMEHSKATARVGS